MFTRYWTVRRDADPEKVAEAGRRIAAVVRASEVPLAGWDGTGEPQIDEATGAVRFNGVAAAAEDYETFAWPPDLVGGMPADDGVSVFDFCKVGRQPYGDVVAAALEAAKEVLGDAMTVDADREL